MSVVASSIEATEPFDESEDREDGELSDEDLANDIQSSNMDKTSVRGDGSNHPTVSISSETEIDRIIQEAQMMEMEKSRHNDSSSVATESLSQVNETPTPTNSTVKNMLDPAVYKNIEMTQSSIESGVDDIELLRQAALVSMKTNGLEDGEVRERSLSPRPCRLNAMGDASRRSRSSIIERLHVNNEPFAGRPSPKISRPNNKDSWMRNDRNRRTRERSPAEPVTKKGNYRKSLPRDSRDNRDNRRSKDQRNDRKRDDGLFSSFSNYSDSTPQEVSAYRPRNRRSDLEQQMIIFGGELPSQAFAFTPMPQPLIDNHDLVSMDVDSDSFTPPVTPLVIPQQNKQRVSVEDESILRNILMEQLSNKKGSNTTAEEPVAAENPKEEANNEDDPEEQYEKDKKELHDLHEQLMNKRRVMRQLNKKKQELMKEMDDTLKELTENQKDYWSIRGKMDEIRPKVEKFENAEIYDMCSKEPIVVFQKTVTDHSDKLCAIGSIASELVQGSSTRSPDKKPVIKQQVEQQLRVKTSTITTPQSPEDMDISLTPSLSKTGEENENNLRQILLQKQQVKVTYVKPTTSTNQVNTAETSSNLLIPSRKRKTTPPVSPYGPQTPLRAKESEFEPTTPLSGQSPSKLEPVTVEKNLQAYKKYGIPVRLIPHAGLKLPQEVDILREVCPFEMSGKCKDYECLHLHLNDDSLKLREIVSMIIWFAPYLSGSSERLSHAAQVDNLLATKKKDEDRSAFLQRLLSGIVQGSGIRESGLVL